MKPSIFSLLAFAALLVGTPLRSQPLAEALDGAEADYRNRKLQAAEELNRVRARLLAEKAPLLARLKASEDRILAAESQATRFETNREEHAEQRRKLLQELDALRKTTSYAATLARDGLKAGEDGLAPGETQIVGEELFRLRAQLDEAPPGQTGTATLDIVEFLLAGTERALGGYRATGTATLATTDQVVSGTFAFLGPETFFHPDQGGAAGSVRPRETSKYPVNYPLQLWRDEDATRFFAGEPATIIADASGGKALRLQETTGTVWEHIGKGGMVAYLILVVGVVAFVMILQKVRDLARMGVDRAVEPVLEHIARGSIAEAEAAAKSLRGATRDLVFVGLRHVRQPKAILEERLEAALLMVRLHSERRLPLLAVIATAAPLMGLLGTVVGMVKTFALITVFGTGNAAKLSSGISEVLVATELGLAVAIPTLVAHGFLTHRIQKNLSLLQRYALEFCTAVETARTAGVEPDQRHETVIA